MKNIYFLMMLLSSLSLKSQTKLVVVDYNVTIDKINENSNFLLKNEQAIESSRHLKFSLIVNQDEYFFYLNEYLDDNSKSLSFAKIISGYTGEIYFKINSNDFYIAQNNTLGNYIIKRNKQQYDWKLTSETKMIDGLRCYKAEMTEEVINPSGTFKFPVVAWYTPEIPLSYGPLGYFGLPGLILEVNRKNVTYGAVKIMIDPKEAVKIKAPPIENAISDAKLEILKQNFLNEK